VHHVESDDVISSPYLAAAIPTAAVMYPAASHTAHTASSSLRALDRGNTLQPASSAGRAHAAALGGLQLRGQLVMLHLKCPRGSINVFCGWVGAMWDEC
jgi:hypothetical protein